MGVTPQPLHWQPSCTSLSTGAGVSRPFVSRSRIHEASDRSRAGRAGESSFPLVPPFESSSIESTSWLMKSGRDADCFRTCEKKSRSEGQRAVDLHIAPGRRHLRLKPAIDAHKKVKER